MHKQGGALSGEDCAQQLRVCVLGPLWEAEGARGSGCAVVSRVVIALASRRMKARAHNRVRRACDSDGAGSRRRVRRAGAQIGWLFVG